MVDYFAERFADLLPILSIPRPNGSRALERTVDAVRAWLEGEGIPVQSHRFTLHPYFMELLGLWMALSGLLPVATLGRWGWGGLALAILTVMVPLLEVRFLCSTVTALVQRPAHNLLVSFPAPRPVREVILCAHLDSKTELLDHVQRGALLRLGRPAIGLALACGVLTAVEGLLPAGTVAVIVRWSAILAGLPAAAYGLGMGANLVGGRFSRRPSTGAADNGAAVAVLLALAKRLSHRRGTGGAGLGQALRFRPEQAQRLHRGACLPGTDSSPEGLDVNVQAERAKPCGLRLSPEGALLSQPDASAPGSPALRLPRTSVTLLLTVGEEAQMQGALAYVRDRGKMENSWPLPTRVVNLEVLGQSGGYLLWDEDGTAMLRLPTDPTLNLALEKAVEAVTGERPVRVPAISSDGFAFLRRGIPAATLGSFDLDLGGRGLHSALDDPGRVDSGRLAEAVAVLSYLLADMDSGEQGRGESGGNSV